MKIYLYDHPFADRKPAVHEADNLGEWLLQHYGGTPQVTLQIYAGEPCAANDISHDAAAIATCTAPVVTVLQSPGDPVSILINIAISMVLGFVARLLTPKPSQPANVNRTQASPNNALGERQNQLRMLQRVEDIYGTVTSVPSLMMPTYTKWLANQKYEYGYYCVGRGYYDLANIKDGDTLIADIPGASAAVYDPFKSPNSGDAPVLQIGAAIIDPVLTVKRQIEVDGITLKALNQLQILASDTYAFTSHATGDIITQTTKGPNFNSVVMPGASVTISMANFSATGTALITVIDVTSTFSASGLFVNLAVGSVLTWTGFADPANNGTFTVVTWTPDDITVSSTLVTETAIATFTTPSVNYSGTRTVASVGDGFIKLTTSTFTQPVPASVASVQLTGVSNNTPWVTLPATDRTEVWANVVAAAGVFKDSGGGPITNSVSYLLEVEQLTSALVPTGTVQTVSGTLTAATGDEQAETLELVTGWTGPARARMRRTSAYDFAFGGQVQDEIKFADLYSVSPVTKTEFGNKTTIHTVTQATSRATAVKSRQLKCQASRKLPTYNGSTFSGAFDATGRLASGTIAATTRMVDIMAAVSVDPQIGARDLALEVDMPQIYAVQQQLDAWHAKAGQFSYTFDSDNTSFEETVTMLANAAFCIAYRQNGKIRFSLDRAQTNSVAVFTHRNKKPDAETVVRKFASDAEYDGVQFVYVDPDTDQSETITLPLAGNYTQVKKFEIPGIRSFEQAWLRANRELYKLLGQRLSLDVTTTTDARALLPNSRIDVADGTRFKSQDGEVIAQSGLELTLSGDVTFTPGQAHSIVLMKRDGSLQSIAVIAGSAANKVILQSVPSEAIVTTQSADGIRTIFSFSADSTRGALAWLVTELDISDNECVNIRAINYSPDYYQADYAAIPAKATVIN
jgi:hypothetical protein